MKERPILFSAEMVRAIIDGLKTQTRRIVKARGDFDVEDGVPYYRPYVFGVPEPVQVPSPYGAPGDRLWVRERAWFASGLDFPTHTVADVKWTVGYDATMDGDARRCARDLGARLRPSIHTPRWASRITLDVVAVRVERLQDITGEDVIAEGIDAGPHRCSCEVCSRTSALCTASASSLILEYAELWDRINAKRAPWSSNPWVWVVTFERAEAAP